MDECVLFLLSIRISKYDSDFNYRCNFLLNLKPVEVHYVTAVHENINTSI